MNKPPIGTTMYAVHEHLYHTPDHWGPFTEYCVCEGTVDRFIYGRKTEFVIVGPSPDGYSTPYYYFIADIGKKVFYTPKEAALYAKQLTERYEQIWKNDAPLRRTWEHYITETEEKS